MNYTELTFNLPEMEGLSQKQITAHLGLYAGYVKNVNAVAEKIAAYKTEGDAHGIALAELTRRYGFEFNGMRLHEIYFSGLGGDGTIVGALADELAKQFGSVEAWKADLSSIAKLRGIGWALLVRDRTNGALRNIWVSDHEIGHLAGCDVLFALDIWEHAFLIDYLPGQRGEYITAVFNNLNWSAAEARFAV